MIMSVGNNPLDASRRGWIYLLAFIASFSAIAYELILASYATFLFGASVFQYSLVISLMMASMGAGSYLSKYFESTLTNFIVLEWILATVAILAIPFLYSAFALDLQAKVLLLVFVMLIGCLIGLEIPLLNKFLSGQSLNQILFSDYLGGFIGGILYPIWFLPQFGFFRTAAILGTINAFAALVCSCQIRHKIWLSVGLVLVNISYLLVSDSIRVFLENYFFLK